MKVCGHGSSCCQRDVIHGRRGQTQWSDSDTVSHPIILSNQWHDTIPVLLGVSTAQINHPRYTIIY